MPEQRQMTRALVGAHFPTTLGWFIPQLFGRYPPRIIPIYQMRKVADAAVPPLVLETNRRIREWLGTHVRSRVA